ncbi:MAG: primosomal protein N' [Proteobacteria bacterium]|nr:primosomal protein N' [Pseudomonadota bacterium]
MSRNPTACVLRVAVPAPMRRSFDYLPPADTDCSRLVPGMRLRVPFGRNEVTGVLLELADAPQIEGIRLKPAHTVLDETPLLPADLLWLLDWASRYYQHPIGEVMQQALPVLLRQGRPARIKGIELWQLTPAGTASEPADLSRAPRQSALLMSLQQHPDGLDADWLNSHEPNWRPSMAKLMEKGWVQKTERVGLPEVTIDAAQAPPPHHLNDAQQAAVSAIQSGAQGFQAFLLDGVTGSGKTEIYLRAIEPILAAGRQALVLVPEIGLTPQLVNRFRRRLATPVAVLHSGLNDQERLGAWLSAARGEAGVVIGTRSALFTPLARPGILIVDEEHDLSFKQQDGFRYSARDLAVVRARHSHIPVVLGSATPALESLDNCARGRFTRLHLPERAGIATPPEFSLIDVRNQKLEHGLSAQLLSHMQTHLASGGQVMLFINRRGFAPVLMCHACGWHARCDRCDAHMTVHQNAHRLRCHHCGSERPLPVTCPECGGEELIHMGYGTQRVAEALATRFPDTPVLRIDRDTTRRRGAMQAMLTQIKQGDVQILVGTQMLAKGHHFPRLTLVALLDADYGLFSADFRAAERLGQLVLQVAGRAGRAERPGEVLIQTHHPDSALLQSLLGHDYYRFAQALLAERQAAELPPFSHLALLRAEAVNAEAPLQFLDEARQLAGQAGHRDVELFGPMPAPMERRAGRNRAQLLLQSRSRGALQQLLGPWLMQLEKLKSGRKVRWSIDVDPMEMF